MQTTLGVTVLAVMLSAADPPVSSRGPGARDVWQHLEADLLKVAEDDDQLQKLLKQRHNAAAHELHAMRLDLEAGRATLIPVLETAQHVTKSKLELCKTREERIAVWEKLLAIAKSLEGRMKKLRDQGLVGGSAAEYARAQYFSPAAG